MSEGDASVKEDERGHEKSYWQHPLFYSMVYEAPKKGNGHRDLNKYREYSQ